MKRVAISVGDLNGVGIEIALKAHKKISTLCRPIYCINRYMLSQACELLDVEVPKDFELHEIAGNFTIREGVVDAQSGRYSYDSFATAVRLCESKRVDAVVTMPIHKEAWALAGIGFKGHTDFLREYFKTDAIMMLGCKKMFVALFTEHIPLRDVAPSLNKDALLRFLLDLERSLKGESFGVLGLNPHAGDNGVLGDEEEMIADAIKEANALLQREAFFGPLVPDVAFTPRARERFVHFVAMYHDQGLAPLKAIYFDESINVSLNLPIVRASVDHGTAFDIAYHGKAETLSYENAIKYVTEQ